MNVAAIIVTRGDQDLTPVLASLPEEWEVGVWNNGDKLLGFPPQRRWGGAMRGFAVPDLSVYGRYAAIEYTEADLIYVQDDDCVVSDPREIMHRWIALNGSRYGQADHVVCNMPPEFRHEFYTEHALVGFGACFHRDAPARAFERLFPGLLNPAPEDEWWNYRHTDKASGITVEIPSSEMFQRTCDIVFTALTPRVLVDVPVTNLPWAHYETRLWRQSGHVAERVRMLDLVRQIA